MTAAERVTVSLLDLDDAAHRADDPAGLTPGDVTAGAAIGDDVGRRRFLATRREVRTLLAGVLGCRPDEVPIGRGHNGKPEVRGAQVHFAVASRGADCVVAVSRAHPVGVHLAPVRADPPVEALGGFLPDRARYAVAHAPVRARAAEFALWWCCSEAAVKSLGAGLDAAVRSMDEVPQQARLLRPDLAVGVAGASVVRAGVRWETPGLHPAGVDRGPLVREAA